jgi:serine/threonine protein kinase
MTLDAGSSIGPYEIVALIGRGGMGEVYHAKDARLDRSVAIKVLTSARGVGRPELERFTREARAIARVNHPSICTVHDVGEHEGVPFLVMERLDGKTLAERLEAALCRWIRRSGSLRRSPRRWMPPTART